MAIVRNVSVPSFYVRPVLNAVAVKPIINTYAPKQKKLQRQHVKDLGDLLLGTPLTGTLQLRHTLQDNDLRDLVYVPVLKLALFTIIAPFSPSKLTNFSACFFIHATLCSISSRDNIFLISVLPEGSPIVAVPPPTKIIGL